jgi:glycine cleavage system H lipoate-binding protein
VLLQRPTLLNAEPYGRGFLCDIERGAPLDLGALMSAEQYTALA